MHTCLTLTNVGGQWYVEVSGLFAALRAYCDSIHSCEIRVEGPSGEGAARGWRVDLQICVLGETVRAVARAPEGNDLQQSLQRVLADAHARATRQLAKIVEERDACCAHGGQNTAGRLEACA